MQEGARESEQRNVWPETPQCSGLGEHNLQTSETGNTYPAKGYTVIRLRRTISDVHRVSWVPVTQICEVSNGTRWSSDNTRM